MAGSTGSGTLLDVGQARQQLLASFSPVGGELVALREGYGRILAQPVISSRDLPLFTHSSMDGFALLAGDVIEASKSQPVVLRVVEDIPAGTLPRTSVKSKQAARIMTGAVVPEGADTVVPVEFTDHFQNDYQPGAKKPAEVKIFQPVRAGENIRRRGQDIGRDSLVLEKGSRLRPQDLGLLAMLGINEVFVYRKPKVAMFSTGDELVPIDQPLHPGSIHDSNAYHLAACVERDGGQAIYLGIAKDREEEVASRLEEAAGRKVDLIISSAGVSVGAFDYVREVVQRRGKLEFWRVNMRPGKPLAFGTYRNIPFIGLPGNPVSAFVGYEVFIRPAMVKMSGYSGQFRTVMRVHLGEGIESDGRESYLRARIEERNGRPVAYLTGHQGSGNLLSLVQANALLIIPSGVKSLPINTEVDAWSIDEGPARK